MTDFTAHTGHATDLAGSIRSGLRLAITTLAAFPASLIAANGVAQAFERGERPSAQDLETLGIPADFLDRAA